MHGRLRDISAPLSQSPPLQLLLPQAPMYIVSNGHRSLVFGKQLLDSQEEAPKSFQSSLTATSSCLLL